MGGQTAGHADESFAAYVSARWSMLYRLATLLVGTDRAEGVTEAALVRTYLAWPELPEPSLADHTVKHTLAKVAVKDTSAGHRGDGDSKLWAEISELVPRQRAMLVLRHYEGLSDAEIADAVGCSTSTVEAESRALETGIDLDDLRDELVRHSDEATPPHPPLDAIVLAGHQARTRRRRQSWRWVAGVAAVVALGLVLASVLGGTSTRTDASRPTLAPTVRFLSRLPGGPPPRIAYTVGRSLSLGNGRQLTLPDLPSAIVQTQTWLYVAYLSGEIVRVDMDSGQVSRVTEDSHGELVTDPAGEYVAWLAAGDGPAVLAVRTVADWVTPLSDEQTLPADPRCCDNPLVVNGMTQDGQVIASLPAANRAWVWSTPNTRTASRVQEISGLGRGTISQVAPLGIVVHRPPFQYAVGRLDGARFVGTAAVEAKDAEFSDPLGDRVVFADNDGVIHVRELRAPGRSRRGSQDVQLLLPTIANGFSSARWEDADHVLLDVADPSMPDGALIRCAVDTGACEVAVRFDSPHVIAH